MKLPPPGADPSQLADYVDLLVRESGDDERRLAFVDQADNALNYYLYGEPGEVSSVLPAEAKEAAKLVSKPTTAETIRLVVNRIQNAIVSLVAIQAGDPPSVTFLPRETGEPPLNYVNDMLPEGRSWAMANGIDPSQPLEDMLAQQLRQEIEMGKQAVAMAAAAGMPPPPTMPEKVLVEVSDRTVAEVLQDLWDTAWEESAGQRWFCEHISNKCIIGWQPVLYEFDPEELTHRITNVPAKHVHLDPLCTDVRNAAYVVYDQVLSAEEAKSIWPGQDKVIDSIAAPGNVQWLGSRSYSPSSIFERQFQREMLVVRTAWIRHQRYPMELNEALGQGIVAKTQIPTGNLVETEPDIVTGEVQGIPETQEGLLLVDTGEETQPGAANWPSRKGIRQITVLAGDSGGVAIEDIKCPHPDIPCPWNKNTPIPHSPYGQSEPERLRGLQDAINRLLSHVVTHEAYNAYPPEFVPQSVAERMDKSIRKMRSQPGRRYEVPDDLIMQFQDIKKIIMTIDSPTMSADVWRLLDLLLRLIDQEGNQSDVMQGDASSSWSGEAIANLQNAATAVIKAKSMFTEFVLSYLAKLVTHANVNWLPQREWQRRVSAYPPQAIQALRDRAKQLYVDVSVEIRSGSGAARTSETNNLVAARQSGVPVSDATLLERLGADPDQELARNIEWSRKQAQAAGPAAQAEGKPAAQQEQGPAA